MVTDNVADTLIRIKNGYMVLRPEVIVRFSKLNLAICQLLSKEGYIQSCKQQDNGIVVKLKYEGKSPSLTDVKRVSKPGRRVYMGVKYLPRVLNGLGMAIVSTPKGLMTDKKARKMGLGGEVMAEVW